MGLFKKQADPLSERSRKLTSEIAELEAKIRKLSSQVKTAGGPRVRSTALPGGPTLSTQTHTAPPPEAEPIFEKVNQKNLTTPAEAPATPQHFNELGARKFDLMALIERIKRQFRGPSQADPRLISYLAAGNIQGLRPLRYEKRVARNRFVLVAIVFVIVFLGLIAELLRYHKH